MVRRYLDLAVFRHLQPVPGYFALNILPKLGMEVFLRLVLFGAVHNGAREDRLALVNDVEGAELVFGSALDEINGLFVITAN